jgi:hypothetical protein
MKILLSLIVIFHLSACAGWAEKMEADRLARVQAINEQRQAACRNYGFVAGTTAFAQCLMQLDLAAQQAYEADQRTRQIKCSQYSGLDFVNCSNGYPVLNFR